LSEAYWSIARASARDFRVKRFAGVLNAALISRERDRQQNYHMNIAIINSRSENPFDSFVPVFGQRASTFDP
jgi:hypothetical protein